MLFVIYLMAQPALSVVAPAQPVAPGPACEGIIVQGGKAPSSGIIVQGGKAPSSGIIVQGGKTAPSGIIVQGRKAPGAGIIVQGGKTARPLVEDSSLAAVSPAADRSCAQADTPATPSP